MIPKFIFRSFSSPAVQAKEALSQLRKMTGFPFLNCKKALQMFDNDIKKAEQWLNEQAQKEGWKRAGKLQNRPMSSGLIGLISKQGTGSLVEVNCETDFVARNEKFRDFVGRVTSSCWEHFHGSSSDFTKTILGGTEANGLHIGDRTLADQVAMVVGNIGENMMLKRIAVLKSPPAARMGAYVHASGPQSPDPNACGLGKFAALVSYSCPGGSSDAIGKMLAQHVVGMAPRQLGDLEEARQMLKDRQSENEESETLDKIDDFDKSDVDTQEDTPVKEEERLLFQDFALDSGIKMIELIQENSLEIHDFVRFQVGAE